jgi:alpha-tubulin suppressor-like RCC1 family protein
MWSGEALGVRLVAAGLELFADDLVALAAPSVGLQRGEAIVEPPAFRVSPVELRGAAVPARAISGSGFHGVAVLEDGSVAAWGANDSGQLGDGTKSSRRRPVALPGLGEIQAVAAATSHSVALTSDGSVLSWGENRAGQLGDGTRVSRLAAVAVTGFDQGVRGVFAGWETSYAVLADGSVAGWGLNAVGLLGIYDSPCAPVAVPGLLDIVAIAVGNTHRLALSGDGAVFEWGWPLGPRGSDRCWLAPQRVDLPTRAQAIAAGRDHALVLTVDGHVLAWGDDLQWGSAAREDPTRPTPVIALDGVGVIAIAAGWSSSFALADDGAVFAWGWNHEGALADGTLTDRPTPVQTACPRAIRALAPRVALTRDGRILHWGGRLPKRKRDDEMRLALGASKLGGHPDLPPDTPWPHLDGRPMAFVAQVRLDELPQLENGVLPAHGLLSFFCALNALGDNAAGRVIYTNAATHLVRAKAPAELPTEERFAPAPLTGTVQLSALPVQSVQLDRLGLSPEQRDAYREALEPDTGAPIHRMLGHPDPIQDDPQTPQAATCLLLQVDSDDGLGMTWGDLGRLYYLITPEDLAAHHFDRSQLQFQSH